MSAAHWGGGGQRSNAEGAVKGPQATIVPGGAFGGAGSGEPGVGIGVSGGPPGGCSGGGAGGGDSGGVFGGMGMGRLLSVVRQRHGGRPGFCQNFKRFATAADTPGDRSVPRDARPWGLQQAARDQFATPFFRYQGGCATHRIAPAWTFRGTRHWVGDR